MAPAGPVLNGNARRIRLGNGMHRQRHPGQVARPAGLHTSAAANAGICVNDCGLEIFNRCSGWRGRRRQGAHGKGSRALKEKTPRKLNGAFHCLNLAAAAACVNAVGGKTVYKPIQASFSFIISFILFIQISST